MDIATLCDKIELQPCMKSRVLLFTEDFNFQIVDELQKEYFVYKNMNDARTRVQNLLGEDTDGIKILSCMLRASLDTYEVYHEKGICDDIFFATMRCFTRFIDETYKMTGVICFNHYWWTTRQIGCHLFRIGELEYEMKYVGEEVNIYIHIPSDADFSSVAVGNSLRDAYVFFGKYFPSLSNAEYHCHSWLLDGQLKGMLDSHSNIIEFQNRFEIFDKGEANTEFIEWLFQTKSTDYSTLPENTSLQKNVKKHLLTGGVIRNSYGRIKGIH